MLSHKSEEGVATSFQGRLLPLNSKLMGPLLKQLTGGLAVMDTDSLYALQQSINEKLSDIAKDHTCLSPGKSAWNEDQATGCQGNLS